MFEPRLVGHRRKSSYRLVFVLLLIAISMFGFGYALVPLYDVLCKHLCINGKTSGAQTAVAAVAAVDMTRTITVQFLATNNANLPWQFYPKVRKIKVHPGENARIAYFAQNMSGKTMVVQAIPSVSPALAARYLKKTECFCFAQQTLKSKESMDMPLLFHLDADLPKSVNTVTLAYTLFDATNLKKTSKEESGRIKS